ncbi:MAG: hypothetical protein NDI94_03460 [Candidatus Woesearchaeota archaeon]|nr:hypothetical protein [Candidatus Woesearchaeota archaeon]
MGIQKRIEELILVALISMNVLEMFNLLPGVAGFFKAVMSFTAIGFVLYKVSLSEVFFGVTDKRIDFFLIFSYFTLIISKFVQYCISAYQEAEILQEFFGFIITNAVPGENGFLGFEKIGFIMGVTLLVLISIYVTLKVNFKEPSILSTIHIKNTKFPMTLITLFGFFIIFFNPVMEWFTLVIDTPLVVIVLFVYIFKMHDAGKNMDEEEILFKISDAAETFVEDFISLFHSKKTIFLGISALLALHLVADIGGYMIPYAFSSGSLYSEGTSIAQIFGADKAHITVQSEQIILLFDYILSTLGMMLLLLFPAILWYMVYRNNLGRFPKLILALFYACLVLMVFTPVYTFGRFSEDNIVGVKITANSINDRPFIKYMVIAAVTFIVVLALSYIEVINLFLNYLLAMIGLGFFGAYLYNYFMSTIAYYIGFINQLALSGTIDNLYLIPFNAIFLILLSIFYMFGYLTFAVEIFE